MIKAKTEHPNTSWRFGTLDAVLSGMANSGSWLYSSILDIDKLKDSLATTLDNYPVFAGRMTSKDCITTNNAGVGFEVEQQTKYTCNDLASTFDLPKNLKVKFDIKACKKGLYPIMAIKVSQLADGTLIDVAINHACADGASLYRFMNDWAKVYSNQPIAPVNFTQGLFPKPKHNLAELTQILAQKHWCKVGFKDLFSMIADRNRSKRVIAQPFFVSYATLDELRTKYAVPQNVGYHALLCAYLSDLLFDKKAPVNGKYSAVSVVNLRGRAIFPHDFIGNAVLNLTSDYFDVNDGFAAITDTINKSLKQSLEKENLEAFAQIYSEALILKAPFIPFDLKNTYGKRLSCILVNNFASFKVYDICFGSATPVKAYPNDLIDNIKIWPGNKQENGVYVFLRGYLAQIHAKQKK